MPMMSMRLLMGVCGALIVSAGCGNKVEMVTQALMTDPDDLTTGGGSTAGETAGETANVPTETGGNPSSDPSGDPSSDPSGDPSSDPTEPTTGPSVPCDTPEGCTGMGSGDLGPLAVPFFRGKVCVSDAIQPGDAAQVSVSACVHPCLSGLSWKYTTAIRAADSKVTKALGFYYEGVMGTNCPPDVFGEFPAEACVFNGPIALSAGTITQNDDPYVGDWTLLVPFLSNDDAAAFAAGNDSDDQVWAAIDSHMQAGEREFVMSYDAGNEAAPAECGEGVAGCTCRTIGL